MVNSRAPLGVLRLENGRIPLPGSCTEEESYGYPVILRGVPGAWGENVTRGDRSVGAAYVRCAREMEAAGCAAVVTTCGFTSLVQADMAAAVSIPVAASTLLLVPMILATLPVDARLAVLTYDASRLSAAHCAAAGWPRDDPQVVIDGIDGTESWVELVKPQPEPTHEMLSCDIGAVAQRVIATHPRVRAILFECTVFPIVAPDVRALTGLPVYDYTTLANTAMGAARVAAQ
jgi:hypothetical protein